MLSHLLSKLPASKAADWGCKVTVCIAALCEDRRVVVAASDMLATLGKTAVDISVLKNDVLFPRWAMMTAGDDIEHVDPILNRARQLLSRKIEHKTPEEVADKLAQAYEERVQEQIRTKVLSRFRYTANTFRDTGKKRLTASVFNSIVAKIAAVRIKLSFLVCGTDREGKGHIFCIDGENAPLSYDKLGFWAIGDGAPSAIASLSFANQLPRLSGGLSLGECVYQVCAAKFMSESVKTVGKQMFLAVYGPNDGQCRFFFPSDQQRIRDVWEQEGAPRTPSGIVNQIPNMLYSPNDPDIKQKQDQKIREWEEMVKTRPSIFQR